MMVQFFGTTCSPTICAYTLRKAAMDSGEHADIVMRQVINHFYVDNWLASFRSEAEAAQTVGVVARALERAGFKLAQWASSRPDALPAVSEESLSSVNMDLDSIPIERTLDPVAEPSARCCALLPRYSTRFLEPVTLRAKLIVQATWRLKLDWDDPLPIDIQEEWNAWLARCLESSPVIVSRCLIPDAPAFSTELHVFADASEAGYGTVAYLWVEVGNDIILSFVMAKSRVGPIKPTTIPRLELNAAVMATRLMNMIKDCLRLNFDRVMFHVDFTTALRWIRSTSYRFHTYVRNRIGEILESSVPEQWHYVRSTENPGDDCSRGLFASELHADHRFLRGPEFLWRHCSAWPSEPGSANEDVSPKDDEEIKYETWIGTAQLMTNRIDELVAKISRLERLVRITA
ncbi:hypothetical protein M514_25131 [Trichuris suis]|uniref:Pao retrotransposon peptidase n=1 Tax=Trichuris suis TaxID=68888 RepID=A0A085MZL0_9BILA|nr:hypothetical protein M514_25131 [Trichuris suis]